MAFKLNPDRVHGGGGDRAWAHGKDEVNSKTEIIKLIYLFILKLNLTYNK